MNPHSTQVALRAGHRCEYCRTPEAVFNLSLEVEHIVPAARGGEATTANWALACRACNLYKATHVSGHDPESDAVVRLFHPREDQWEDHFQITPESGEIVGRTPDRQGHDRAFGDQQCGTGRSTAAVDAPRPFPLASPGRTRHCT